jgi:hypothetical protein
MDGSQFEPLNAVEAQLIAAGDGDAAARAAFERALADATLYVATPEPAAEGERTLAQGETLKLLSVQLNDGREATAIFTAQERIAPFFGDGVGYAALPGKLLFEMIHADPAILNPGQVYGVVWEPDTLAAMAGLAVQRTLAKNTQVMLGSPSNHPTDLLAKLKQAFEPMEDIQAAWLALAFWPETNTQAWYLDVRSDANPDPIRRALANVTAQADLAGRPLDMVIQPTSKSAGTGLIVISRAVAAPAKAKAKGLLGRLFG